LSSRGNLLLSGSEKQVQGRNDEEHPAAACSGFAFLSNGGG
jgi:hypothetical protein